MERKTIPVSRLAMPAPDIFTPPQLAKRWGCTPASILALIQAGELRAFSTSPSTSRKRRWKITLAAVADYECGATQSSKAEPQAPVRRSPGKRNRKSRWAVSTTLTETDRTCG